MGLVRDLVVLTKFRINALAVFTGYAALVIHGGLAGDPASTWLCLLGLLLIGGCANTLNQVFERDKDALMERTRHKRPLPTGRISVGLAVVVVLVQGLGALAIFALWFVSWLAVVLCLFTVAYYSFFYTLYLKPRHHLNIVIGGVPGAMGPLIAWAAVSGNQLSPVAWALFLLVFLWTPPHAWALAIKLREDYARAGIPMLPVVKGVDETTRQIFAYTVILVAASLAWPWLVPAFTLGPVYGLAAVLGGAVFLGWTWRLWRTRPLIPTMPIFAYSLLYIAALFGGLVIDVWIQGAGA